MSFITSQNSNSDSIQTSLLINEFYLPAVSSSDMDGQAGNDAVDNKVATHQFLNEIAQYFSETSTANELERTILGTPEDDNLDGDEENNVIFGNQEDDNIQGRDGHDSLYGGKDDDSLSGNSGHDLISGENGNDLIFGNEGRDIARGGEGEDSLYGGQDSDLLFGDNGNDLISGDDGNDLIFGNQGEDIIRGGEGSDIIHGGQGNDLISGGNGDDLIYGDDGNDLMIGGNGNDLLTGGLGEDTFRFEFVSTSGEDTLAAVSNNYELLGIDTITDFNASEDRIELDSRLFPALNDTLRAAFSTVDQIENLGAENAVIIYESSTGSVYYNPSNNAGDEVEFLKLDPNLDNLDSEDFASF